MTTVTVQNDSATIEVIDGNQVVVVVEKAELIQQLQQTELISHIEQITLEQQITEIQQVDVQVNDLLEIDHRIVEIIEVAQQGMAGASSKEPVIKTTVAAGEKKAITSFDVEQVFNAIWHVALLHNDSNFRHSIIDASYKNNDVDFIETNINSTVKSCFATAELNGALMTLYVTNQSPEAVNIRLTLISSLTQ
jgi:hypothetical protein